MNYKEETIKLIQRCNDIHWLKVIYAYVSRLLGGYHRKGRRLLPFCNKGVTAWRELKE